MIKRWELFPHMADIGIRGVGGSAAEAFEMGASALTSVITDLESVGSLMSLEIRCRAPGYDFLFYEWVNALIYEMEVRNMIFSRFEAGILSRCGLELRAQVSGEVLNVKKHRPAVVLKGATMTELKVEEKNGVWTAQCVVDV